MTAPCPFCTLLTSPSDREIRQWNPSTVSFTPLDPIVNGHTLVVPRQHVADLTVQPNLTAKLFEVVAFVARELWPCNVITSAGVEATQSVFHLHVHVVPRRYDDGLQLPWTRGK